ncbi:MAG: glycosyltransferase [Rubrobacteraceae bacterium]
MERRPDEIEGTENLRDELRARSAALQDEATEAESLRQQLDDLLKQMSSVDAQRRRQSREVKALNRWGGQLSDLLNSRRWKVSNAPGKVLEKVWTRFRRPTPHEELLEIMEEFHAWLRRFKRAEDEWAEGEWAKPRAAPTSPPSAASEQQRFGYQRFGSAEYVLDALRGSRPVTIIVPIHNAHDELKELLSSVVENTTASAELLLIDDASTDPRIPSLLAGYEALENVRILTNEENLGFSGAMNRGFAESGGNDVVIVNSDVEVTPRWLENMRLAAYADPRTATVTALSDNAGAFSVPMMGEKNDTPEGLERDDVGRLVTQWSAQVCPDTPTGNGFCMYVKREALEEVGGFDEESFPRGYAEENDFCMRAKKLGYNHVVDDATFVFHERAASFGSEKKELLKAARKKLDGLHPEYTRLAGSFLDSADMKKVAHNVLVAYRNAGSERVKPRLLFVIHGAGGGTSHTNLDLMGALADRYSPYVLVSNTFQLRLLRYEPEGPVLVEKWDFGRKWEPTEFSRPDYRAIVFGLLVKYRFELVHIRHLMGHTFDLPEVAARLGIPVVLSFHDFYFSCPTVQLIDDNGKYCGGNCTPGTGRQCTIMTPRLEGLPILKHAWLGTWRLRVERMFEHIDAFVTMSRAAKEIHLRSLPVLRDRPFEVIEHGRDLEQARLAAPPGEGPVRILVPGHLKLHKGLDFIRKLKQEDSENRIEFHFLGEVEEEFRDLGVDHGLYEREELNDRVREIRPSFMGIFSIWPETYCHTLTEAWAAGVPVLASDIGALRERVNDHGGGWLIDFEDPKGSYERILRISGDRSAYARELERANLRGIKSTREMSDDYEELYNAVIRGRRPFESPVEVRS